MRAWFKATTTTIAASFAKQSQIALQIPELPPVTTATLSFNRMVLIL
jgi:hypothetical protein